MNGNIISKFHSAGGRWTTAARLLLIVAGAAGAQAAVASDPLNGTGIPGGGPPLATVEVPEAAVFIDFDTYPDGTPVPGGAQITTEYATEGVTFDSRDCGSGATQVTIVFDTVPVPSAPNALGPCGPVPFIGATLVMNFDPPVTMVSAFHVDDQFPVEWSAFDAAGSLVDTAASDGTNEGFDQVSVASLGGIVTVIAEGGFWSPDSPDGWGIDDLVFEQAAGAIGGAFTGVDPAFTFFRCTNETTGQEVSGLLLLDSEWNCESAGLLVSPGDTIRQIAVGRGDAQ